MRRPAFTVVSSSVAALVLLGFATRIIRPRIPKPVENELALEKSEFLSRASTQRIDWKKPVAESFAQARRRDRPILLFIGTSYSPLARGMDEGGLKFPRIQAFLARNFECIRVDTLDYPEFRNAFLPVTRGPVGIPTSCQLWVLDPSGKVVDLLPKSLALNPTDENAFVSALVQARQRFEHPEEPGSIKYAEAQSADAKALLSPSSRNTPLFREYTDELTRAIYEKGGFQLEYTRSLTPEAWRYLLASGYVAEFKRSIDPVLTSPLVDLIDGGFFQGCRDADWVEVDFDKSAIANADMLRIMANAWVTTKEPLYRYLAERTFDCLATEFVVAAGFSACRPSDAGESLRSMRSSFGVRKLRESLPDNDDYRWAQTNLGLRVEENPRMGPHIESPKTLQDREKLDRILGLLRNTTGKKPECTSAGFMDVTGYCVARLIEAARLLNDPTRMQRAQSLFSLVEESREGVNVMHSQDPNVRTPYLSDYLAYSDAALQLYLATGSYPTLQAGRSVLLRALEIFDGVNPGILKLGLDRKEPLPTSLSLPEVSDSVGESATALAIRLCQDYGRIFNDDPKLRQFANDSTAQFALTCRALGVRGAGFFLSARSVFDDEFFVSIGPKAQEWADRLSRSHPFRLSVAAFGDIRADLGKRGPGVYLVRGEVVRGPMTPEEAANAVSPFLGPGL